MTISGTQLVTIGVAVACGKIALAEPKYTVADLESLDKQESWHELLAHAADVPPAQRTDRWNVMVERAALGVLTSHAGEADAAWTFGDAAVEQYPSLNKSRRYMMAREQASERGLDACLRQPAVVIAGRRQPKDITPCVDRAVTSAEIDAGDPDAAFRLAKMIEHVLPLEAVRVYRRALAMRHAATDCSDKELGRSVGDALVLTPGDTRVVDAQAIAFDVCWDGLKEALIDRFISESSSKNFRTNTCSQLLGKKDALSPMSKKQCEATK
jgi:hypothetical protein